MIDPDISFEEYQKRARATAIYPHQGEIYGLAYAVLGLVDEVGEVVGVLVETDLDNLSWARSRLAQEIGDVQWYCAQVATEVGTSLALWNSYPTDPNTWEGFQRTVADSIFAVEPDDVIGPLVVAAAKCAGLTKKALRDDNLVLTQGRTIALGLGMSDVMVQLAVLANLVGVSLGVSAGTNLEKLASRAQRGVLQGSGDER